MHLMRRVVLITAAFVCLAPGGASAQSFRFDRAYDAPPRGLIDVSTIRGRITIVGDDVRRVTVRGEAVVRSGFNVPADAIELARAVAARPPIEERDGSLFLRPPTEDRQRRAVTVHYVVTVPRGVTLQSMSESGATTIREVNGAVTVETQSAAIVLRDLGGSAEVATGSGSVEVDGLAGDLRVRTESSGIRLRGLGRGLHARTQSGRVEAGFEGEGDVDVETGSSQIDLAGVRGGMRVRASSGRVRVSGTAAGPWDVETGSSAIELTIAGGGFDLEAHSGSGSVRVDGGSVDGVVGKDVAVGRVGGGGPAVRADSRSGSIRVRVR